MTNNLFTLTNSLISSKIYALSALGITMAVLACNPEKQVKQDKTNPNVVLIVADDLGCGDLSCYGATKISTPAIDQLASEGMSFTNAYVSSSLCSPSRYSILTGRYSWRTRLKYGVLKYFDKPLIEQGRTTVASLFKRNGFHTACVGKWHLGLEWELNENAPEDPDESVFNSWAENTQEYIDFSKPVKGGPIEKGFDYFFGMAGSNNMQPYVYIENDSVLQAPSEEQKQYDHYVNALKAPNWNIETVNQVLTHKAVEVINKHFTDNKEQPLFLYFPTSAIHRPCLPTFTKGKSRAGLRGDIVVELDWTVNEIIQALKENNAYENTLLIFTSDNGPRPGDPALWIERYKEGEGYEDYHQDYFDEYGPEYVNKQGNQIWKHGWITYGHDASGELLGFKVDAWDGGLKVPFIANWPDKIGSGTINKNTICLSDLLATFSDLLNDTLKETEGEDSYSFLPNLFDVEAPQVRKSLTIASGGNGALIGIKDRWKYIEAAKPGRWAETFYPDGPSPFENQLYRLGEDMSEQNNLYSKMPEKVSELVDVIERVRKNMKSEGNEN